MKFKTAITASLAIVSAVITVVFIIAAPQSASAVEPNQIIRFYKINSKEQAERVRFTAKKARKPGCHNFIRKVRVHRVVQIGYNSCAIYSSKNCAADSAVVATREKRAEVEETDLSQGYSWFPVDEHKRGARLKSWSCK